MLDLFWYLLCILIGIANGCLLIVSKQYKALPLGIVIATAIVFGLVVTSNLIFSNTSLIEKHSRAS